MAVKKRITRSRKNKVLTGLFGGLGDYFNIDPTILRLVFILILVFSGFLPGLIFYIVGSLIVPEVR